MPHWAIELLPFAGAFLTVIIVALNDRPPERRQ